jgi:uncharacterized protein (DUF58 family)
LETRSLSSELGSSGPPWPPNFGLDSTFLQKLEQLALLNRHPLPGPSAGPRRSPRHGASVEFADFRDYAPGDDFRRIDWKAYARLDRLFLRLYSAEEMTTLTLLLDHSLSMHFGEPSKALMAARLAAIFSYVALHGYDRVAIAGWAEKPDRCFPAQAGKAAVPLVWRSIAEVMSTPATLTDFTALRDYALAHRRPGLAIVISDFLSDTDWRAGLRTLRGGGQEVSVIQILAREELEPTLRGDWKLRDVETAREIEVTISSRLLHRYKEELTAHTAALRDFCHRQDMVFLQIPSDAPLTDIVLRTLRTVGVLE